MQDSDHSHGRLLHPLVYVLGYPSKQCIFKRHFFMCLVNFWYSFWNWPCLISNLFGILLWVILRQSSKGTLTFAKRKLWIRDMFPWLPESQARVPFQSLPSSDLKTASPEPLSSSSREKCLRPVTSLRVLDCRLFTWGNVLRHRNSSNTDGDRKANGI